MAAVRRERCGHHYAPASRPPFLHDLAFSPSTVSTLHPTLTIITTGHQDPCPIAAACSSLVPLNQYEPVGVVCTWYCNTEGDEG
eukprot:6193182-Pleurochrysis_carterae.AAC.6